MSPSYFKFPLSLPYTALLHILNSCNIIVNLEIMSWKSFSFVLLKRLFRPSEVFYMSIYFRIILLIPSKKTAGFLIKIGLNYK